MKVLTYKSKKIVNLYLKFYKFLFNFIHFISVQYLLFYRWQQKTNILYIPNVNDNYIFVNTIFIEICRRFLDM